MSVLIVSNRDKRTDYHEDLTTTPDHANTPPSNLHRGGSRSTNLITKRLVKHFECEHWLPSSINMDACNKEAYGRIWQSYVYYECLRQQKERQKTNCVGGESEGGHAGQQLRKQTVTQRERRRMAKDAERPRADANVSRHFSIQLVV